MAKYAPETKPLNMCAGIFTRTSLRNHCCRLIKELSDLTHNWFANHDDCFLETQPVQKKFYPVREQASYVCLLDY